MPGYDFDLDIEAELAGIRGHHKEKPEKPQIQEQPKSQEPEKQESPKLENPEPQIQPEKPQQKHGEGSSGGQSASDAGRVSEPEEPSLSHSHGGKTLLPHR